MKNGDLGAQVLGSLIKSLESDFTKPQASALVTLALYTVAFHDQIQEYWEANQIDVLKQVFSDIATEGSGHQVD